MAKSKQLLLCRHNYWLRNSSILTWNQFYHQNLLQLQNDQLIKDIYADKEMENNGIARSFVPSIILT